MNYSLEGSMEKNEEEHFEERRKSSYKDSFGARC